MPNSRLMVFVGDPEYHRFHGPNNVKALLHEFRINWNGKESFRCVQVDSDDVPISKKCTMILWDPMIFFQVPIMMR